MSPYCAGGRFEGKKPTSQDFILVVFLCSMFPFNRMGLDGVEVRMTKGKGTAPTAGAVPREVGVPDAVQ